MKIMKLTSQKYKIAFCQKHRFWKECLSLFHLLLSKPDKLKHETFQILPVWTFGRQVVCDSSGSGSLLYGNSLDTAASTGTKLIL